MLPAAFADLKLRDLTLGWFDGLRRLILLSLGVWTRETVELFNVSPQKLRFAPDCANANSQIIKRAKKFDTNPNDDDNKVCFNADSIPNLLAAQQLLVLSLHVRSRSLIWMPIPGVRTALSPRLI